jgi:hypothetical protein
VLSAFTEGKAGAGGGVTLGEEDPRLDREGQEVSGWICKEVHLAC